MTPQDPVGPELRQIDLWRSMTANLLALSSNGSKATELLDVDLKKPSWYYALENSNKWILLDMDCAHLFILWASSFLDMIVVDLKSGQDVPLYMMRIDMNLYTGASEFAKCWARNWPDAVPRRQRLLIPGRQLNRLLLALRTVELAYGLRVMPGETHQSSVDQKMYSSNTGEHGLSMRIRINENYPKQITRNNLEYFRMFHGPLNELSIIGAPDHSQAQSIESSISSPRDTGSVSTFHEILILALDLMGLAQVKYLEGFTPCASFIYEQIYAMLDNACEHDMTPWDSCTLWANPQGKHFEILFFCVTITNPQVYNILTDGIRFRDSTESIAAMHIQSCHIDSEDLKPQFKAYLLLINGLHSIFRCKIHSYEHIDLASVMHGLDLINESQVYVDQISHRDTRLFQGAYKLREIVMGLSATRMDSLAAILQTYDEWFRTQLKPVKWRVHESFVPQPLRDAGVLESMENMSHMKEAVLDQYLVIDTLKIEEGTPGDYYLF